MSYTQVFGGNTIYPSDVSYLSLALSANVELEWPLESAAGVNIAARIIDVTPSAAGYYVDMPDATLTGAGQVILFNNVGLYTFYVRDFSNNIIATVASGEQWELYLAATTTAAGTWRVFRFGASTATVQPSALAGFGLTVSGSQLAQSTPVVTFSTTGETLSTSNRASAWVWIGTGTGTLNLPSAVTVGNNYFVMVRNSGGGDLVIDPTGAQTINDLAALTLRPGDSATLITDGAEWYTVGFGQEAVFAFDFTQISVTGGTYTLSGAELNRIAYRFVGTLSSNLTVIVPSTVQQYWVTNSTTGAYTLSLSTSGGTPVAIAQNARGIYYCDGSNVLLADTASLSFPIAVAQGGTGAVTASAARLNLGITSFADGIVTATTGASVRSTIGAAASGANGDITSLTGLTTPLSAPQGGTGQSSYAVGDILYASTTTALSKLADVATGNALISGGVGAAPSYGKIGLTTHVSGTLPTANGGTNLTSFTSGGAVYATSTSVLTTGTLPATAGGTGQASYAIGDLLFASTTTALSKLADVATGNALISGGVGVAPSYGKIGLTTHVSGTLPVASGGTGATTLTGALIGNGTGAFTAVAPGTAGNLLTSDGTNWASTAPTSVNQFVLVSTAAPSAASEVTFTGLTSTYSHYIIVIELASTGNATFRCQMSVDNGSSYAASFYYSNLVTLANGSVTCAAASGAGQTYIDLGTGGSGYLKFTSPGNTGATEQDYGQTLYSEVNGITTTKYIGMGRYTYAANAIRIFPATGTITGTIKLYGVKA